jgi:hypothetical protein
MFKKNHLLQDDYTILYMFGGGFFWVVSRVARLVEKSTHRVQHEEIPRSWPRPMIFESLADGDMMGI